LSPHPLLIESRSIDYVPLAARHGKLWHLWPVWFTGGAHLATIATGFVGIALGGNLVWMSIAVLAGCAFGTFFMAFHSTQGPQLGLPQMIQSRPQFGYLGALLVWLVALITGIGYCSFNFVLAADTVLTLGSGSGSAGAGAGAGAGIGRPLTIVLFGALAAALAVAGYDLIHIAQRWLAYLLIAVFALMTLAAARLHFAPEQLALGHFSLVPFLTQFFAAAAYQLSWSISVSDYSRYLPRDVNVSASFWWTYIGALLGGAWPMLIGTVAAALFPALELTPALRAAADTTLAGSGSAFLVVSLLGLATITTILIYSASLTLLSIVDSIRPSRPLIGARVATIALVLGISYVFALMSSAHFAAEFGHFLAILLYLFTPWTAINLVDFFWVRRGHYSVREIFNPRGMYGRWCWRGLIAYFGGFAAMIPFFSTGLYTGPIARMLGGADIAMLVGLPFAAGIYLIACRSVDLEAEKRIIAVRDAGLDAADG
jgi:purine-cytosine permease-like protein